MHAAAAREVSVDLSSWSAIEDHGAEAFRALLDRHRSLTSCSPTRTKIASSAGRCPVSKVDPQARAQRLLVFRGRAKLRFSVDRVVDSTGAGDALAAGFIVGGPETGTRRGRPLRDAARVDAVSPGDRPDEHCGDDPGREPRRSPTGRTRVRILFYDWKADEDDLAELARRKVARVIGISRHMTKGRGPDRGSWLPARDTDPSSSALGLRPGPHRSRPFGSDTSKKSLAFARGAICSRGA